MPLIDVYFVFLILPLALIFLGLAFYQRGAWWWSMISGLLWILFGFGSMNMAEVFHFQRELSVVWIVVGFAIFWMPAWYKKKGQQKTLMEMAEEADREESGEDEDDELDREVKKIRSDRWRRMRGRRE